MPRPPGVPMPRPPGVPMPRPLGVPMPRPLGVPMPRPLGEGSGDYCVLPWLCRVSTQQSQFCEIACYM